MARIITIDELQADVEGTRPQRAGQLARAREVLAQHPEAVIVECADEKTGVRFGRARCRAGQCVKLGSCRQPLYYQLWASWALRDITLIAKAEGR